MKYFTITLLPRLIVAGCFISCFIACSSSVSYDEAMSINEKRFNDQRKIEDAKFLVRSKSSTQLQLELLTLASASGYSSDVVNLGKDNMETMERLDEELTHLASKEKVQLPDALEETHEKVRDQIKASSRSEFDGKFITALKNLIDERTKDFTTNATEASDPDIRAFAARKIGELRAYGTKVEEVEKNLLTTVKEQE